MKTCSAAWVLILAMFAPLVYAHSDNLHEAQRLGAAHEFEASLDIYEDVVRHQPQHGTAWLHIASLSLIVGDIERAREACRHASRWVDPIASAACQGRIALVGGGAPLVFETLSRLLASTIYSERGDAETLWAIGVAAELAVKLGRDTDAEHLFHRVMAGPVSPQIRVAYADYLLARGKAGEALLVASDAGDNIALALRHLLALKRLDREAEAEEQVRELDHRFRQDVAAGAFEHAREQAYYFLYVNPDPAIALVAAMENFLRQKEPEDLALLEVAQGK